LADRVADVDLWRGPIALCRERTLRRGTYGTGTRLGWVCTSSEVEWEQKGIGKLRINWEVGGPFAANYFLPLDDWREETVELYPKVERHAKMTDSEDPANTISPETIELSYQASHGSSARSRADALEDLQGLYARNSDPPEGSTWEDQLEFGMLLYHWLVRGHETYYLAGVKYMYIHHYFSRPITTKGGFIQSPQYGPRAGDTELSWLRFADATEPVGVNGSVIRLISSWLGGPDGHWDSTLYPSSP
jgi:hypothetical protein